MKNILDIYSHRGNICTAWYNEEYRIAGCKMPAYATLFTSIKVKPKFFLDYLKVNNLMEEYNLIKEFEERPWDESKPIDKELPHIRELYEKIKYPTKLKMYVYEDKIELHRVSIKTTTQYLELSLHDIYMVTK